MLQLTTHDTVADIGSFQGYFPALYSVFSDSVVIHLNDIFSDGFVYFDSIVTECERIGGKKLSNEFALFLGTEFSTNLPSQQYNKVIARDAIHHFSHPDSMLVDLKRIMKPNARLIVYEPLKHPKIDEKNLCKGVMTKKEFLQLMKRNGFRATKKKCHRNNRNWFEFKVK